LSPYRLTIDRTTKAIGDRARNFRNLVVSVSALAIGSILWAALTRTPSPLTNLLLVLPVCGSFFVLDARLLNVWRASLFEAWVGKDIDFHAFREAANSIPNLPKDTLQGMLETLPPVKDLVSEQRISPGTRAAIAAATENNYVLQSDTIILKTVTAFLASVSVIVAVNMRSPRPLSASISLLLLPPAWYWLRRKRAQSLRKQIDAAMARPDFNREKYAEMAHWTVNSIQ